MPKLKATLLFLALSFYLGAQQVADRIVMVVGKSPVLLSEIQNAMIEQEKREMKPDRCKALEMLAFQKLLVTQADKDSVTVSDAEVENELSKRMAHFISMFESEEALERFYGKRTNVLKDELRPEVHEQMLAQKMQGKITGDYKPTPSEVRQFYKTIPEDSLPLINSEVELQQIVKKPQFSEDAKKEARETLEGYRERILKGESFRMLARLYTEDPGSQATGGEYRNITRGKFDPAFESVAFRLKEGEISNVFESSFGYHIIELIKRKGEMVDIRHILIMPKMSNSDLLKSKKELDSIYTWIRSGKYTFEEAAQKFSDDKETKNNGGLMVNPITGTTKYDNEDLSQIDKTLIPIINSLESGEFSKPVEFENPMDGYRIVKLKRRIDPHKLNVKDDYQKVAQMAVADHNKKQIRDWIRRRSKNTYIKIEPDFDCRFENDWILAN